MNIRSFNLKYPVVGLRFWCETEFVPTLFSEIPETITLEHIKNKTKFTLKNIASTNVYEIFCSDGRKNNINCYTKLYLYDNKLQTYRPEDLVIIPLIRRNLANNAFDIQILKNL